MGKKPDEIYHEITEHRAHMTRARSDIDERVRSDLSNARERMSDQSAGIGDRVSEHPLSYLAGGFGSGVALGMLVPGVHIPGGGNGHNSDGHNGNGGDGEGAGLMGMLSGTLVSAIDDTVRPLMQDVVAGFTGDERPPRVRDRQP